MTAKTVRVYTIEAQGEEDLEDYSFSVIADDKGVEYVLKTEVEGDRTFSEDRVRQSERILSEARGPIETADDWLDVGMYRFDFSMSFDGPEYESIEQAREGERAFAEQAREYAEDLADEGDDNDVLLTDDDGDGSGTSASGYLVYLDDSGRPMGLLGKVPDAGWSLRRDGEWVAPTEDDIDEVEGLEDYDPAYVSQAFVAVWDESGTKTEPDEVARYVLRVERTDGEES